MKKLSILGLFFTLLTAFTCENEPLEGEFSTDEQVSCNFAIQNVLNASLAFSEATSETYVELCSAYKTAIQNQILFCGDPDGSLQQLLDSIGECSSDTLVDSCAEATAAVGVAQAAFDEATAENYFILCNNYREALLTLIEFCGPDGGTLSVLNDLGNCEQQANAEGIITVTTGTIEQEFDIINVFENDNILEISAETGSPTYHIIYFEIPFGDTGLDIINESFSLTFSSQYWPSTQGFDDFTSTITTNVPGNLIGTFSGIVTNAEGADLSLSSGVISVAY